MLGQQLKDLLEDDTILSSIKESKKWFSSVTVPPMKSIFKRNRKMANGAQKSEDTFNQKIFITPIGSQRNSITHFAIELESADQTQSQHMDHNIQNSQQRYVGTAMTTMG
jgi:hypothetical protein